MRIEWDFNELFDFGDKLVEFSRFEAAAKQSAQKIAKVLLRHIKGFTPIGETGELIRGWDGNNFLVTEVDGGFEVSIVNTAPYAADVNDGHKAYNQFGGPYKIHNERRIKVPNRSKWQKGSDTWYVYGHFFVERGIEQFEATTQIETIVYNELRKWWEGCKRG